LHKESTIRFIADTVVEHYAGTRIKVVMLRYDMLTSMRNA